MLKVLYMTPLAQIVLDYSRNGPRPRVLFFSEWAPAQGSRLVGGPSGLRPTQGLTRCGRFFVEKNNVFRFGRPKKRRNLDKNLGGQVFLSQEKAWSAWLGRVFL